MGARPEPTMSPWRKTVVWHQRLGFFNNPDATVRPVWETSDDAGKSWQVSVDGIHKKKGL